MGKTFAAFVCLVCLAGCSGAKKPGPAADELAGGAAAGGPPGFALPGVPLKSDLEAAAEEKKTEAPAAAKPAEAPAAPAEPAPAPAPAAPAAAAPAAVVSSGDLDYHLNAAKKYSAKKKYRSAAAEYGAALPFLPAGDFRAARVLERQGAMLLKAGDEAKAQEQFLAAIKKAQELGIKGSDLSNSYLGLGYCQEQAKKIPEAIASYEKALEFARGKTMKARIAKTISDLKKAPK